MATKKPPVAGLTRTDAGILLPSQPKVAIANKLAQQLTRIEQEFGMTPASRTRIQLPAGRQPLGLSHGPDKSRFFRPA